MHEKTCDSIWDALSAYADGAASAAEVEQVEGHVADCPTCARDLAFMRQTTLSLGNVSEVMPPAYLREAILAATIHRVPWYRRAFTGAPARGLAMAGAMAAVLGIVLISRSPSTPPVGIGAAIHEQPAPRVALGGRDSKVPDFRPSVTGRALQPVVGKPPAGPALTQPEPQIRFPVIHIPLDGAPRPVVAQAVKITTPVKSRPVSKSTGKASVKPKPADSSAPDQDDMPDETPDVLDPGANPAPPSTGGPMIADARSPMPTKPDPAPAPVPPVGPQKTRISLAASADSLSPGQVASLADLRKSLKRPSDNVFNPGVFRTMDRRELRIDIYKSHF